MYITRKNNVNGFMARERKVEYTHSQGKGCGCMVALSLAGLAVAIMYYISTIA